MSAVSVRRRALDVDMVCHRDARGWTEIVALGGYTDRASIFDHSAFDVATARTELRNALRRHARTVKALNRKATP